jgi:hypothetical protein
VEPIVYQTSQRGTIDISNILAKSKAFEITAHYKIWIDLADVKSHSVLTQSILSRTQCRLS